MILEDIVESTKERVETNKKRHSIYELKEKAFAMPIDQSFPFKKALEKDGMSYILEVKRHSPSKGQIVSTFDFKAIADIPKLCAKLTQRINVISSKTPAINKIASAPKILAS